MRGKCIKKDVVMKLRLKGKVKCPACGQCLSFIYEGSVGLSSVKCSKCGNECMINTETLDVHIIIKVG